MDTLEIKGKVNTALCYAKVVEDEAIEQIRRMCDYEFTEGSKIRIMPDVHSGKGCTIGTTMTIRDKAVPNIVGVDIGCGMLTINLGKGDIDFEKLDAVAHYIPSGMNVWEGRKERFDLQALRCYRELKRTKWLERSLGKQVAEIYQCLAVDLNKAKESLSLDEYKETMSGVYTTSVNEATLDEAPMTYKRLEDIIDVIKESVEVIDVMKPIYNFKASE